MAIRLYMNHNVRGAVTRGLRHRDVDVLTAFEDGSHGLDDPPLLDRAGARGRVLFTNDDDLLREADENGCAAVGSLRRFGELARVVDLRR